MSDIADEITNSVDKDGQTVITGPIDYNGNALILDVDGDSKLEVATDDRLDVTLGGVLSLSLTSTEALKLDAIAALAVTDGNFIVGNGTTFVAESGSTARTSLGVDLTTKGTILAGNGTAPATVSAGTNDYVLTADSTQSAGVKWAAIPDTARDYQAFTASGTWTKPADSQFAYVEVWSGGGGGANTTASNTTLGGASGGEYVSGWFQASALGGTETVTVGAGGSGGATAGDNNGSTGGASSFGSWLAAVGGNPGVTSGNQVVTVPRSAIASTSSNATGIGLRTFISPQAGHGGAFDSTTGGNTIYGGAGGGASDAGSGGTSAYGGNGGAGNNTLNTAAGNGVAPGGGGGSSGNNGGGGNGARGEVRVWTW
jgi:hypothetical protein